MDRVMSDEQIFRCYSIAKDVFENKLSMKEGVEQLDK